MPLTPKQELFVAAYLETRNATRAAMKAGYSKKTAASQGGRLLQNVEVKKRIGGVIAKALKRADITADLIIEKLGSIAFADLSTDAQNAFKNLRIKTSDQVKALELLGKNHKLFTDVSEHGGIGGGPVVILKMPSNGSEAPQLEQKVDDSSAAPK